MPENRFRIFRWLVAIVVLLTIPSLLLATLWFSDARDEVRRVDLALEGMEVVEVLQSAIIVRAAGGRAQRSPRWRSVIDSLPLALETKQEMERLYEQATAQDSNLQALIALRDLFRLTFQATMIEPATPEQYLGLPPLIIGHSLSVAHRSLRLADLGSELSGKEQLNPWDRMAFPVQGGQYKFVSDETSRLVTVALASLPETAREPVQIALDDYRAANHGFQRAAGELVRSFNAAQSGSEVSAEPLKQAYPELSAANVRLLLTLNASLRAALQRRNEDLSRTLLVTSIVCIASLFVALVAAACVSRSLTKRTRQELHNVGHHDPLTGLPNRRALVPAIDQALAAQADRESRLAVLHVNLVRFKAINDTLGVELGDALLCRIAADLSDHAQADDLVARLGGDEFVVVSRRFRNSDDLVAFAGQLCEEIAKPKMLLGQRCRITACVGIAETGNAAETAEQLLLDAELALRAAKKASSDGVQLFDESLREVFENNHIIAQRLRLALDAGHIEPWFQPQVCIDSGAVLGFEALVRWIDPQEGILPPFRFLPVAEEFNLCDDIDKEMRRKSLAALKTWNDAGVETRHIGLNMSASQLAHPDLVEDLVQDVVFAGLTPEQVSIEILEAVMLDETEAEPIKANVAELSELGFYIELDDFGTGHSGLSCLRDLKVNRVKIDRSFVSGVDSDPDLATLTNALIQLARSLGIAVLAEGVETEGERRWLQDHGCQVVQGYLISKPLPGDEIEGWCRDFAGRDPVSAPDGEDRVERRSA